MTRHRSHNRYRDAAHQDEYMFRSPNPKTLYRSRTDRIWLGVCGGIANRFGWEPTLVRLLVIASVFFMFGPLTIIGYIVAALIIPTQPRGESRLDPEEDRFWQDVSDRPRATASGLKYTFMDLEERLRNLERNVTSEEWKLKKAFRDLEQN